MWRNESPTVLVNIVFIKTKINYIARLPQEIPVFIRKIKFMGKRSQGITAKKSFLENDISGIDIFYRCLSACLIHRVIFFMFDHILIYQFKKIDFAFIICHGDHIGGDPYITAGVTRIGIKLISIFYTS